MSNDNPYSPRRILARAVGHILTNVPELARLWGKARYTQSFSESPLVRVRKPLNACRLALITTGGVHQRDQEPFNMSDSRGDPTYRELPAETPRERLMITHDYYNHEPADTDLNILLPMGLCHELVQAGHIGSLATCYSFMGHIEPPHVDTLNNKTAPQVAGKLKQDQVDAVLLTPA